MAFEVMDFSCADCLRPDIDEQYVQRGYQKDGHVCTRCNTKLAVYALRDGCRDPHLMGHSEVVFTTCTEIEPWPTWVWDTNRYYRDLGVSFRATKREIRERYMAIDGQSSPRLTHIVRQLVNDETRRKYDAVPLGAVFMDDEIEEWMRHRLANEAQKNVAAGRDQWDGVEDLAIRLGQMDPTESVLDGGEGGDQNLSHPRGTLRSWAWSWYSWNTGCTDTARLAEWQGALSRAFEERGERTELAVGFGGADMESPCEAKWIGYRLVAFLNDNEQPTEALAQAFVSRVVQYLHPEPVERAS